MEDAADGVLNVGAGLPTKPSTNNADTLSHLPTPSLSPIDEHHDGLLQDQPDAENHLSNGHESVRPVTPLNLRENEEPDVKQKSGNGYAKTVDPPSPAMKVKEADLEIHGKEEGKAQNGDGKDAEPKRSDSLDQRTLKLSPAQIVELTSSPGSIPWRATSPIVEEIPPLDSTGSSPLLRPSTLPLEHAPTMPALGITTPPSAAIPSVGDENRRIPAKLSYTNLRAFHAENESPRPATAARSNSSPLIRRKHSSVIPRNSIDTKDQTKSRRPALTSLKIGDHLDQATNPSSRPSQPVDPAASAAAPAPSSLPLPPLSLPTYLQLELSSERPSALYIHRSLTSDIPYESSKLKFERLLNFLLLPPQLEQTLIFGALACLDSWLYTFTILPLRFCKAVLVWLRWGIRSLITEVKVISAFIHKGFGRFWQRQRSASLSAAAPSASSVDDPLSSPSAPPADVTSPRVDVHIDDPPNLSSSQRPSQRNRPSSASHRHRRTRSTPSALLPNHKADILQGLLIIFSCIILLRFDASRIYHNIRGQSAIKLYVIYNTLEVFDRLFAAIGQDVLECLFSKETLERKPNGRSKVIRPFWMFVLALAYNVIHAAALFYQVITLNVAVNSYSNALLTLLMSNQFVEIKGSVFKKLEKENLFQMTCADVVERFQLWLMLLIIALRNIVEVGGLSINIFSQTGPAASVNATGPSAQSIGILPKAFTLIPKWSGQVMGPFLIVLGSEMLVDWLKHAYINKFNGVKPQIYGRFLDVLAKDYYSNAFVDQNLMKRLGLPVLPLACLFIRASVQTYHMFVATHMPLPIASTATALAVESASSETSPATTAALAHIDLIFRRALGRSSFGAGLEANGSATAFSWWSLDDVIALTTMLVFFLVVYFLLLAFKLVLGMCLLSFARGRYEGMRERERQSFDTGTRRLGGWGAIEVDEDKRKWIYEDDDEGLRNLRAKEAKAREKAAKSGGEVKLDGVGRYMMVAKRIW
ncbi:hypothetical protein AAFC00_000530 [Neodothiora populina]|uniref:DUF747-domain-containing protein n=1 Tax=Neodothiora populina TaxID=2781224 RepID=A0ABR3PD58_9PEZI